jgi:hypothetical protein
MKALDLSKLSSSDNGAVLELRHPVTGEVLTTDDGPVTITLLGSDSDASQKAQRDAQRRRLRKGPGFRITPEMLEAESLTLLATLTQSWQGIGLGGEEELPCTEDNVKRVYTEVKWIRKQVESFITEIEHFLGN